MVCCHFGSFFSNERLCEYKKNVPAASHWSIDWSAIFVKLWVDQSIDALAKTFTTAQLLFTKLRCVVLWSGFSSMKGCVNTKELFLLPLIGLLISQPFFASFVLTNQIVRWKKLSTLLSYYLQNWDVLLFEQVFHQWKVLWMRKK